MTRQCEVTEDGLIVETDQSDIIVLRVRRQSKNVMRLYAIQLSNANVWRIKARVSHTVYKNIVDLPYDSLQEEVKQVLIQCARLGMDDGNT